MLKTVNSFGLNGIDGFFVRVEVNLSNGLPAFDIVGLPDAAVKEARERVRAALRNCGYGFPTDRLTVNLAPADLRKEGPMFDLPIAVGIIAASEKAPISLPEGMAMIGELSLDGGIRPVRGALPVAISARQMGCTSLICPKDNARELICLSGMDIFPASNLTEVVRHLAGQGQIEKIHPVPYEKLLTERTPSFDFQFVKGQLGAKRALEIAAAGGHNVLMIGPPGSGKTLLARCVPGIMPDMTFDEALEVTRIHSVAGTPPETGLFVERPFRSPHHTASSVSLIGGGTNAMPGEISKAHNGVLFLDELPEYKRDALEVLRQPMEDGFVTITRVASQGVYPSSFMLVCSMNPCPCGNYGSRTKQCRCSPGEIRRYLARISGPLLDRIDMHIEVESIPAEKLSDAVQEEASEPVRLRVQQARDVQRSRYRGTQISCNARLDARTLDASCPMEGGAKKLLASACEEMGMSNRVFTRIIKVARTIADLDGSAVIRVQDIAEAVQYRSLDRKYWR